MAAVKTAARKEPSLGVLSFGFVICGIVTVLPGPMLPLLAGRWHLADVQSGAFFTAEFVASTIASVLAPKRMRWSLPRGYALMTIGVLLLVVAALTEGPTAGHLLALGSFLLIGFGIGLSVTATNLVVGAAPKEHRARRLSVVNLWWGIGAVACPWMVAAAEKLGDLRMLLVFVAWASVAMFVVLISLREERGRVVHPISMRGDAGILIYFAIMLFLYVGVENSVGGWVATYVFRYNGLTLANASLVVSAFWLMLLLGRWIGSQALKSMPERAVLLPSICLSLAALVTFVAPHERVWVIAAAALTGLGFGPIFPIGVARMLSRVSDARNTGWVFAITASGGAVLPWLTGLFSTKLASLRTGFMVPAAGLAVVLLLALAENLLLGRPNSAVLAEPAPVQEIPAPAESDDADESNRYSLP
ncbi:MAG TPA: MFS transporter [Acidobacteriaceae bacterium]|nr:MFS transporter [Acidobacteriaceae bacterium]